MNVGSNLALLLQSEGRREEWAVYSKISALAQFKNPYRYYDQAQQESQRKNYNKAISLYKKAIKLAPYNDRFYFAVFQNYLKLNKPSKARNYLKLAEKNSATVRDRAKYNIKLALLAAL